MQCSHTYHAAMHCLPPLPRWRGRGRSLPGWKIFLSCQKQQSRWTTSCHRRWALCWRQVGRQLAPAGRQQGGQRLWPHKPDMLAVSPPALIPTPCSFCCFSGLCTEGVARVLVVVDTNHACSFMLAPTPPVCLLECRGRPRVCGCGHKCPHVPHGVCGARVRRICGRGDAGQVGGWACGWVWMDRCVYDLLGRFGEGVDRRMGR